MRKKKKDIFIVTNSDYPFGGASANYLRLFSLGLVENDINVKVVLQRGKGYKDCTDNQLPDSIEIINSLFRFRPKNVALKIIDTVYGIFSPIFVLLLSKTKPDLVFFYNYSSVAVLPTLLFLKIFNISSCNIVVEWYEKGTLVKKFTDNWKWFDFLFRMKIINQRFDYLLVLTRFMKNYYVNKGYKPNRICLQPNFVDSDHFQHSKLFSAKNSKEYLIGYCGSPIRKDGIIDLLEAFRLFNENNKNSKLIIIGDIPGNSVLPELRLTAEEKRIENCVEFIGLVPFKEISKYLHECDVLVLARPSGIFAEAGFPSKIGEYLSCKKPVVVTSVGDIPYYFRDGEEVLLADPDSPESVCERLRQLYNNKPLGEYIALKGYEWTRNNLDYHKAVTKVIHFFESDTNL